MGPAISEGSFKLTKKIILAYPWRVKKPLFTFNSPEGKGVMWIFKMQ